MKHPFQISDDDHVLRFASEELYHYIKKLNNSVDIDHISFEIFKDNQDDLQLKSMDPLLDDQYDINIKVTDQKMLYGKIKGSNSRSILLAVYRYLYHLGFRFLRPGKEFERIPDYVDINRYTFSQLFKADYRHRGVCIEGANSLENVVEFIDWLPKLGYNSFFVQFQYPFTFLDRWYQHRFNPTFSKEPFDMNKAIEYSAIIDEEIKKRGLLHHRVGHGWTCETIGVPALGWDREDKVPSNTDLNQLALLGDKREFFKGVPINTNLCYSNPSVQENMSNIIVQYAKNHPEVDYLHVWLADTYNNICECEQCKKDIPTDQYIRLLNLVDEKLEQENLDTKIVFLLYQELLWAPKKESFKNPKRFVLMFAPISRTFESSYKDAGDHIPMKEYVRNDIELPTNLEENLGSLYSWKKVFDGDSFVYDYPLGRAHYGDLSYTKIAQIINKDIKYLHNYGLNGYISCQELRCFLPNALPNYVMGITLFNKETSYDEIEEDYYKSSYGSHWKFVRDYLNQLGEFYNPDYFNGKGDRVNPEIHKKMEQALSFIKQNKRDLEIYAKEAKEEYRIFWNHLLYHYRYTHALTKALSFLSKGDNSGANQSFYEFWTYICSNEKDYQKSLDVYRITEVSTVYTGFQL